jgi:hypothetical protein
MALRLPHQHPQWLLLLRPHLLLAARQHLLCFPLLLVLVLLVVVLLLLVGMVSECASIHQLSCQHPCQQ